MYAIIQTGGKQYRVTEGQTLKVEKLPSDIGKHVDFKDVLMVTYGDDVHIGVPYVKDATVTAEVVGQGRAPKIEIIKLKRRKHHLKHQGHRQGFTAIKITGIAIGDKKLAAPQVEKPVKAKAAKKPAKKVAKKAAPKAKVEKTKPTKKAEKKSAKKTTKLKK